MDAEAVEQHDATLVFPHPGEVVWLDLIEQSRRLARKVKRGIDIVLSALALLLLAPLFGLIALAIALDSPGPLLYRQMRVGQRGRTFTMLKFRSMRDGGEAELPSLLSFNEAVGPVFKIRDDPRVTRVGWVLRRFSLDELPQFLNVLYGDMSLVGPRPPLPHEVERYTPRARRRLAVRPGMTCIWQISGRSDVPFDRWVEMDLQYIERWSLLLDLKILLLTIPAVLSGRGAY